MPPDKKLVPEGFGDMPPDKKLVPEGLGDKLFPDEDNNKAQVPKELPIRLPKDDFAALRAHKRRFYELQKALEGLDEVRAESAKRNASKKPIGRF